MLRSPEDGPSGFEPIDTSLERLPTRHPFYRHLKDLERMVDTRRSITGDTSISGVDLVRMSGGFIDRMSGIQAGTARLSADRAGVILLVPGQVEAYSPIMQSIKEAFPFLPELLDTRFYSPQGTGSPAFLRSATVPFDIPPVYDPTNKEQWGVALQTITNKRPEPYDLYGRILGEHESCERIVFAKRIALDPGK